MVQDAVVPVPARVQLTLLTVNVPVSVLEVPTSVSVTVTVHVNAIPMIPVAGHATVVVVLRVVTVIAADPELAAWIVSGVQADGLHAAGEGSGV